MFQFKDENGAGMDGTAGELVVLLDWELPAALGGRRRWAFYTRPITLDSVEYAAVGYTGGFTTPVAGAIPTDSEEQWQFELADPDGTWATRLKVFAGGTKCVLMAKMIAGETESANAMTVATGWVQFVFPNEDAAANGRFVRVALVSEFGVEERDATLPASHDAERAVDENANSLKYSARAATASWGGRQGTRRRGNP